MASERLAKVGALAAAALLLAIHFASFDFRDRPLVTDVRYYVYFAWQVAEGAVHHLDIFDNKTQLATYAGTLLLVLGRALGVEPLMAIRVGYLGLTAIGGLLAFAVFRRLGGDRDASGLLAVLAYCAFGLLGVLPAVGNGPKLLMALGATAAALLAYRRRWLWAGLAGGLAFMDWQIGALVWIAVFATACALERPRGRPALLVALGGAAGVAPLLVYYAAHGALRAAFEQIVVATLFRAEGVQGVGILDRLGLIREMVGLACPEQEWLFYTSGLGLLVVGVWLWQWRGRDELRLLMPLAIYHTGLVAFSAIDFQWYGDFYALLHSAAFFLAALWVAIHLAVERSWAGRVPRRAVAVAACLAAVALARPGPLRPDIPLDRTRSIPSGVTLADQVEVADAIAARIGNRRVAFLEHCELLYLMRRRNALPTIFWNRPNWSYFRDSERESFVDTAVRLVREADPDVVLFPHTRVRRLFQPDSGRHEFVTVDFSRFYAGYTVEEFVSSSGRYRVALGIR